MTNLILCGGSGTRLWPVSRTLMPKQFIQFFDNKSLFQLTINRNQNICDNFYIVSNQEQYFLALDQYEELNTNLKKRFLLEPFGRNTAPAIALSCFDIPKDEIVLVTPSDHLIKVQETYENVLREAKALAKENFLVTFGINPTFPETGYGYIEAEGNNVISFKEKPDVETAKNYLKKGSYFWNSGMFMFKAGIFLKELKVHSPNIYEKALFAFENSIKKDNITYIKTVDMENIPEDSIDYAVMESSEKVKVIPANIEWNDLGSFDALYEELPKDADKNTINKNYISIDSKKNFIFSDKLVSTIGIQDLIIVDTPDALLISKKGNSQKIKDIVKHLKKNSDLHMIHLTVHRPWGTYTVLEDTPLYKVKKIVVKPKKRLSLQSHKYRSEHWIVVEGEAMVTKDDQVIKLQNNQSTYISANTKHRLENKTDKDIVLIEVQVGSYLGEDDIIRYDDDFERFK